MSLSSLTVADITHFLGWCTLINLVILAVTTVAVVFFKTRVFSFYARLLDLDSSQISQLFYRFLVQYEVAVLILNLVPYLALRIIS